MKKLFGTDGIRGIANAYPITPENCIKIAMAMAEVLKNNTGKDLRVIISKDTRLSGYLIETALTSGFIAMGINVMLLGPMPTPAVSMLVRSMRADMGIMISASHNPYNYNGIKVFDASGHKISEECENAIEQHVFNNSYSNKPSSIGKCYRLEGARERYIEFAKSTINKDISLNGLQIVIDTANGASYKIAPTVLWELGCDVTSIHDSPNGYNINDNCGAVYPEEMQLICKQTSCIGISLDGDADRVVMCDESGRLLYGDELLAIIAKYLYEAGTLKNNTVVVTEMSNLALEVYLTSLGIKLIRTAVGDKYVVRKLIETNTILGGETSGHIILYTQNTSGDGLVAALQILYIVRSTGMKLSELAAPYHPLPQVMINVSLTHLSVMETATVKNMILSLQNQHKNNYRILVRRSGTEPLVRILVEGQNEHMAKQIAISIRDTILQIDSAVL